MRYCLFLCLSVASLQAMAQLQYPKTKTQEVTDDYFGKKITDPYRWLEDDNSAETKAWVIEQNTLTRNYFNALPARNDIRERIEKMWNFPKYSSPFNEGNALYYFKNDGLQNQSVLMRQKNDTAIPEVFLDPNTLSANGTVALSGLGFSKNATYAAYSISKAGSDWNEAYVIDVATKNLLTDKLSWIKFSGLAWKGDEGFFYSRYPEATEADKLSVQNKFHKIYYHKIGTAQTADVLIYEDAEHPLRYVTAQTSEDNRFLIMNVSEGTSGTELWAKDISKGLQAKPVLVFKGFTHDASFIQNIGNQLYLLTNKDAQNFKLVTIDVKKPEPENWKTIIPETTEVIESVSTGGGKLFVSYLKDASSKVFKYDMDGKLLGEVVLPGIGSASGFGGKKTDDYFYYSYTSFTQPNTIFKYNISDGKSSLYKASEIAYNPDEFETKQVFFASKDGTKVPVFLSYKKGLKLNGNNPLLLYGYGGFNISLTPSFSISNLFFMQQGGIYAQVNLRGGGEYGEAWHKAGMLGKKQNVFDDFIGAAEFLIKEKYTSSSKLAIEGGSNGGLLIGACMTQRPELFKVALPAVGVMDMLRFQKFTIGYAWVVEYGSSDNKNDFDWLIKYSPYHNLKPGTAYPATLVTTADHDDRVVPAHSFKYAARLQASQMGNNPTLISIETDAGHGAGKPTSKLLDEIADKWAFVFKNLDVEFH